MTALYQLWEIVTYGLKETVFSSVYGMIALVGVCFYVVMTVWKMMTGGY